MRPMCPIRPIHWGVGRAFVRLGKRDLARILLDRETRTAELSSERGR